MNLKKYNFKRDIFYIKCRLGCINHGVMIGDTPFKNSVMMMWNSLDRNDRRKFERNADKYMEAIED